MDAFKDILWQALSDGFIYIVHYANRYFSITDCEPLELWPKLMIIEKNKPNWKGAYLIVEICLCAPFGAHRTSNYWNSIFKFAKLPFTEQIKRKTRSPAKLLIECNSERKK